MSSSPYSSSSSLLAFGLVKSASVKLRVDKTQGLPIVHLAIKRGHETISWTRKVGIGSDFASAIEQLAIDALPFCGAAFGDGYGTTQDVVTIRSLLTASR